MIAFQAITNHAPITSTDPTASTDHTATATSTATAAHQDNGSKEAAPGQRADGTSGT